MAGVLVLVSRFLGSFVIMVLCYVLCASLLELFIAPPPMRPELAKVAAVALSKVALLESIVLSLLVHVANWRGWRLALGIVVTHFGIETFMSQNETLYFLYAIKMPWPVFISTVSMGFLRALLFAPMQVTLFGKWSGPSPKSPSPTIKPCMIALQTLLYVAIYYAFGYFVLWQFEEARVYYSQSSEILPFHLHMLNAIQNDPWLIVYQVLRGPMWSMLTYLLVSITSTSVIGILVASLNLSVLSVQLLFPNPYIPDAVCFAHLIELTTSMFTYGIVAGLLWRFSSTPSRVKSD